MKQAAGLLVYCPSTKRFLIAKRGPTINDPNLWATFGGKMDKGESIIQTAEREFKEESGYNNTLNILPTPMPVTNDDGFVFTTFLATVENEFTPPMVGQVTVDGDVETAKVRWVDIDTLKKMIDSKITHPGFNNFLKKYINIKENNMKLSETVNYPSIKNVRTIKTTSSRIKPDSVCIVQKDVYEMGKFSIHLTNKNWEDRMTYDAVLGVTSSKKAAQEFCDEFKRLNNIAESINSKQKMVENYIRKIVISEMKKHL